MRGEYIASLIGLLATSQIHISKGLQRYGIEGFRQASSFSSPKKRRSRKQLYVGAIVLNNAAFFWVLLANLFADPAAYTSMFGFGLIILMLFSEKILKEKVGHIRHVGAILLGVGTFFLGWAAGQNKGGTGDASIMAHIDLEKLFIFILLFYTCLLLLLLIARWKQVGSGILGGIIGIITGSSGALDPIIKAVSQHYGGRSGLLPSSAFGWLLFLGSFLFGAIALGLTQAGFAWKMRATVVVPFHNMSLILLPLLLLSLTLPGYSLSLLHIPGLLLVGLGMVLLFIFT
jgi:hypothetical protein